MSDRFQKVGLVLLGAITVVGLQMLSSPINGVQAQADKKAMEYPEYRVVSSDGTNLIVTDQLKARLYFYTIDPDAKVGSDLKLRASIDLSEVGKPSIKPIMPK